MIALARLVLSAIASRRDWLTLLAVALVGAGLYVAFERVRHDRDAWAQAAATSCFAAGAARKEATAALRRDRACLDRITALAAFRRDAEAATARLLAEEAQRRERASAADAAHAGADARAARDAATKMEEENAKVRDDQVGPGWFDALNHVAGLRGAD
jgi:hypothetical protein